MPAGVAMRHTLGARICSNMTIDIVICLHSPQTGVCPMYAGVFLGTTISIVIHCISRLIFLPNMTLDMSSIFTALRSGSIHCVSGFYIPLARLLMLSSIFAALRLVSIRCVLRYLLGFNLRCRRPLLHKNLLYALHDFRRCRMSSQPSNHSLSAVCWDLYFA